MVKSTRPIRIYLLWMMEEIEKLERYLQWVDKDFFLSYEEKFDACLIPLIQLWETAAQLMEHHDKNLIWLPLLSIKAVRNILVHVYHEINKERIRNIIIHNIPELKKDLQFLLSQEN